MEVGEYVKTKQYGEIGKILKIVGRKVYIDSIGYAIDKEEILKSAKNIIDLIEVGDIVKILLNEKNEETTIFCFESQKQIDILNEQNCHIIKSIVTKEQFASMEYKIESEDK